LSFWIFYHRNEKNIGELKNIFHMKKFYEAEEYHQNYLQKHPNGYCPNHSTGVKFAKEIYIEK